MMKRKRQTTQSGASQGIPFVLEGERGYDQNTLCTCLRHKEYIQKIIFMFVSACMEVLCIHLEASVARGHLIP